MASSQFTAVDGELYWMTTDEFFEKIAPSLPQAELVLIDADHHSAQAFKDFGAAWEILAPDGLIVLHDTYPENEKQKGEGYCCDSWRVPEMIRRTYPGAEVLTLPFPPGLTLVRKV